MEFPVTIESQDQFDGLVKDRIKRAEAKAVEPFADYDDLKAKAGQVDELTAKFETDLAAEKSAREAAEGKVQSFETEKQVTSWRDEVAKATGVPAEALRGSNKEEFEAHAETLKPFLTGASPVIPNQGNEPDGSTVDHGTREFADFLTGHRTD